MTDKEKEEVFLRNVDALMALSRLMYLSAVKVGFSEPQAMAIVISHMNATLNINKAEVDNDSDSDA